MPASSKLLIIYNPTAGHAARAWPLVRARLEAAEVAYDLHETRGAGDATARTRDALRNGHKTIAVVGGDGTLGEAATGFFALDEARNGNAPDALKPDATFAPLPAGTGNDFTRALADGQREPLEQWLKTLTAHLRGAARARTIDVIHGQSEGGESCSFIALNMVSLGLSVEAIHRVRAQGGVVKKLPGEARFVLGALGALAAWRERAVRVTLDNHAPRDFTTNLLAFANSRYAGGGMMFAPNAQMNDGWLDAVLTGRLTRATILRELPRIRRGAHVANPKVTIQQARRVRVETPHAARFMVEADSNLCGHTPLTLRVLPSALRVMSP